jgi:signal transduction histidine kinase/DNA-binding response OmpR family regulator
MIESNLFQSLFDVIPFGVYVSDIATDEIVYMNIYMRERAGARAAVGNPCWKAIYRQEAKCIFCHNHELIDEEGLPNDRSVIFEHFNDADDRWYQLQEKAMNWPDGRIVKYAIAVDITELKQAQNHLAEAHAELSLKSREAQQAECAKSAFITTMSHELRTPLNSIIGYAQLMQKDPGLDERYRQRAEVIHRSGNHLLALINDVLDVAKLEAGKLQLQPTAFSLDDLLQGVLRMTEVRAAGKGLDLRFRPRTPLPRQMLGDDRRLRQILLNLLGNAVKFTERGSVTLEAAYEDGNLTLTVTDTGAGIPKADCAKLFSPFVQVGDRLGHHEGSGLGLAISYQLVELMDGRLQVKSEPGVGSRFFFTLPMRELKQPDPPKATRLEKDRPLGYQGERRTVHIVEDAEDNRHYLASALADLGFEVSSSCNGREALQILNRSPQVALIMTDLLMPEMDGIELIRQLRRDNRWASTAVIAYSAAVMQNEGKHAMEAGADLFLPKPVSLDRLIAALGDLLKLEWIAQQGEAQGETAPPEITTGPDADQARELMERIRLGQTRRIINLCEELSSNNPQLEPFCQEAKRLAQGFEHDAMERLVKPFLQE